MVKSKNRSKGNTRPSNSGHSAEILVSTGLQPLFVGFHGFQRDANTKMSSGEDLESIKEDDACKAILKKLLKRDSTTKLKAVVELLEYCQDSSHDLKCLVPAWPRFFNRLALDPNIRVRELIHKVNEYLISKVKQECLPYLKSFMGTWLITQCDPHYPAACNAQMAFASVFQKPKQADALMFCQSEVLKVINEGLFAMTEDSLSDDPEGLILSEKYENYRLVVTCCIAGITKFISYLSEDNKRQVRGDITSIVSNPLFWRLATHGFSGIRSQWFLSVRSLCVDMPLVFEKLKVKLIQTVMGSISERKCCASMDVWDCVLQVISSFPDCWNHVDFRKSVFPVLITLLGPGMEVHLQIFPYLLPFLSSLPEDAFFKDFQMIKKFFTSLRESILIEQLKTKQERDSLSKTFLECMVFTIDRDSLFGSYDIRLITHLASDQLMPLIETSLQLYDSNISSEFYPFLGRILLKFESQAWNEQKRSELTHYGHFLSVFWNRMGMLIKQVLDDVFIGYDRSEAITSLRIFFSCLHSRLKDVKRKLLQRLFAEREILDDPWHAEDTVASSDSDSYTDTPSSEGCVFFKDNTIKTCQHLFRTLKAKIHPCCLEFLSELIHAVNSPQIYFDMLSLRTIPPMQTETAPEQFFEKFIMSQSELLASDGSLCDSMLNILFCICSCLETERALDVLDRALETDVLFCRVVISALRDSKGNDALFGTWFYTERFGTHLCLMTNKLIENLTALDEVPFNKDTLLALTVLDCISEACSLGGRIPVTEVNNILLICATSMYNPEYINSVKHSWRDYDYLHFISDICQRLYNVPLGHWRVASFEEMLFQLFRISVQMDEYDLPDDRAVQIKNEWKSGLLWCARSSDDVNYNFIARAADYFQIFLQEPMNSERQSYVRELASEFLLQVQAAYRDAVPLGAMCALICKKMIPLDFEWKLLKKKLKFDFIPSVLQGNVFYPIMCEDNEPFSPESAPQVIVTASSVAFLFKKLLISDDADDMQRIPAPSEICGVPLTELFLETVPHLLWALCYVKSRGYFRNEVVESNPSPYELENFFSALTPYFKNQEDYKNVLSCMFNLSLSNAEKWALPLAALLKQGTGSRVAADCLPEMVEQLKGHYSLDKILTMQVCCQFLPQNEKVQFIKEIPDDFFKVGISHYTEEEYFGLWAEMNGCLTESSIFNSRTVSEKLLCFLADLTRRQSYMSETSVLYATNLFGMLHIILRDHPALLKREMWKYIFNVIKFWFKHCVFAGPAAVYDPSLMVLLSHACTLISIISHVFGEKKQFEEIEDYSSAPANVTWHDLFDNTISKDLVNLFLTIAGVVNDLPHLSESVEGLMYSISHSIDFVCGHRILLTFLSDDIFPNPDDVSPDEFVLATKVVYDMINRLIPFLTSKSSLLQLGAHLMLKKLMPLLPRRCEPREKNAEDSEAEAKDYFQSFPLVHVIKECGKVTTEIVNDVPIGSRCVVEPYTSSFRMTSAYLFAWLGVLEFFKALTMEERSMFGSGMEDSKLLPILLENLIRLLPESTGFCCGHVKPVSIVRRHRHQFIYVEPPPASSYDQLSSYHLQHWACFVYFTVLQTVPTMVRRWFKNLEKKVGEYVENFTTKTVSGRLSMMEINAVTEGDTRFENMVISTRPQLKQVLAQYKLDDTSTELKITVPRNYPLGPIVAEVEKTMGVSQAQLRYWLLQLNTALNYHNSSITDALARWKRNLDRRFDGIEGCMICFCVFDSSTSKIPGKTCSTCKKKFHDTCLYRWFSTSNNSSCPLCRNFF